MHAIGRGTFLFVFFANCRNRFLIWIEIPAYRHVNCLIKIVFQWLNTVCTHIRLITKKHFDVNLCGKEKNQCESWNFLWKLFLFYWKRWIDKRFGQPIVYRCMMIHMHFYCSTATKRKFLFKSLLLQMQFRWVVFIIKVEWK